jgi:hypothetical protein
VLKILILICASGLLTPNAEIQTSMSSSSDLLFARVEELKRKSFDELSQMPAQQEQKVACSDGRTTVAVWKDGVGDSELRIVVQAYQPGVLVGRMQAAGFRVTPQGIKELQEGELAEFS